ncbi:MAG: NADH-quinone oxidoreductase subunit H, partial [Spirochaetales bacterium]|nr:NADH-quinone oxidoreductase subunit H [Spirochaetales bacterium]
MSQIPVELVKLIIALVAIAAFVGLNGLVLVYLERKVAGFVQRRPGPYEVGPQGLLQPLADAVKLIGKQLFTPSGADKLLFWTAPVLSFLPVLLLFLPIPFGPVATGMEMDLGLLLILAFAGLNVLALCLAGWGSNNKCDGLLYRHGAFHLRQLRGRRRPVQFRPLSVQQHHRFRRGHRHRHGLR